MPQRFDYGFEDEEGAPDDWLAGLRGGGSGGGGGARSADRDDSAEVARTQRIRARRIGESAWAYLSEAERKQICADYARRAWGYDEQEAAAYAEQTWNDHNPQPAQKWGEQFGQEALRAGTSTTAIGTSGEVGEQIIRDHLERRRAQGNGVLTGQEPYQEQPQQQRGGPVQARAPGGPASPTAPAGSGGRVDHSGGGGSGGTTGGSGGSAGSGGGGGGTGGGGGYEGYGGGSPYDTSGFADFDAAVEGIPFLDNWSGAQGRRDAARAEVEAARNRAVWGALAGSAPSVDDLTSEYFIESDQDEYGNLLGGPSSLENFGISGDQETALRALREMYEGGGYTDADRAMSQAMRAQRGQAMRAANQAALQQMQARGMGGSGAELAARMGTSEATAFANAQNDASIQQAAMMRALQSMQNYGSMANTVQGQELQRRQALDAFNQQNLGWRRDREQRNTGYVNRTQDSRANARQQSYQNQESAAAGMTGQYSTDVNRRLAEGQREDELAQNQAQFFAALAD